MQITKQKTKTQITINDNLALIVSSIQQKYPIYDLNGAIEYLIARGSGDYLSDIGLTTQDLRDIAISKAEINNGDSVKANNSTDLILKLKA
jgi:hypothetical protein